MDLVKNKAKKAPPVSNVLTPTSASPPLRNRPGMKWWAPTSEEKRPTKALT